MKAPNHPLFHFMHRVHLWARTQRCQSCRLRAGEGHYKDRDLIYARSSRCPCGAGLAYPVGSGSHHYWDCSGILTGRAAPKRSRDSQEHTDQLPFAFWKVKTETRTETTRPAEQPQGVWKPGAQPL